MIQNKKNIHDVFFGKKALADLNRFVSSSKKTKLFILVDENTLNACYPQIMNLNSICECRLIKIKSGEKQKNIATTIEIWESLSFNEANKSSLFINLGGGVISDIGGFAASTFKRGIDYVNVPTTLLSQVDASIGGKTGIDFISQQNLVFKNQIGTIKFPRGVFIFPEFLNTLNNSEILSGFAEIIKHALIMDPIYWRKLIDTFSNNDIFSNRKEIENFILPSIKIKTKIVEDDPKELGLRKSLNFGHTFGHAIEGFSLAHDKVPLSHGRSVAIGIICEAFISNKISGLKKKDLEEISQNVRKWFPNYQMDKKKYPELIKLMQNDKKNTNKNICFSLLQEIGKCLINQTCEESLIRDALNYYFQNSKKTQYFY